MLRSMTGFGRCLVESSGIVQQWEVKSVNSRHLDIRWRLPLAVRNLEPRLEKQVRSRALRGRVEISLALSSAEPDPRIGGPGEPAESGSAAAFVAGPHLNIMEASAMLDSLASLAKSRGDVFVPDYNALLQVPSLWNEGGDEADESLVALLKQGLCLALDDWNDARAVEGKALAADLSKRGQKMLEWLASIESMSVSVTDERTALLQERLASALAAIGQQAEDARLLQEVVILTDRLDVSEELTRLSAHLSRFAELLQAGGDAGRRLDFTLQECFREINTCGNKLSDADLSRIIVDFKNELEKCREQVQNLE